MTTKIPAGIISTLEILNFKIPSVSIHKLCNNNFVNYHIARNIDVEFNLTV